MSQGMSTGTYIGLISKLIYLDISQITTTILSSLLNIKENGNARANFNTFT